MYDMLETFKARIDKATQEALGEFEAEFNRRYSILRGDKAEAPKVAARDAIMAALDDPSTSYISAMDAIKRKLTEIPSESDIQAESSK